MIHLRSTNLLSILFSFAFLRRWLTTSWSISSFLSSSICGNNCFHVKFDLSFALLQEYPWGVIIHSLNAQMWISVFSFLNNLRSFLGIWYGYSLLRNNWRQFYGIVIDVSMEILTTICCVPRCLYQYIIISFTKIIRGSVSSYIFCYNITL